MLEPYHTLDGAYICCEKAEEMYDLATDKQRKQGTWMRFMGSHYHCARCWGLSSMMGHHTNMCKKYTHPDAKSGLTRGELVMFQGGPSMPRHMCCPDKCQFDSPEEFDTEAALWSKKYEEEPNMWIYRDMADEAEATAAFARKVSNASA